MPPRFDGQWLRSNFPDVAQSMDRFIDKIKQETQRRDARRSGDHPDPAEPVPGSQCDQPAVAPAGTSDHPFARSPVFLVGDSAMGSPYFQSISLGFECAMFLAGLLAQRDLPLSDMLDRYELYIYKQWLRVYMRSKMIKHNKDLFECIDDPLALLGKLHIY